MTELVLKAEEVAKRAYAPYSNYFVGAAVMTSSGQIFSGCNVENASYSCVSCAEAGAVSAMIRAGERQIAAVLTICDGEELGTCCGACRQRVREFAASLDIPVYAADRTGVRATFTLDGLLPHSFGPSHLHQP